MSKKTDHISEHIASTQQALLRLMLIISTALPHLEPEIAELIAEWDKINKEINIEYGESN